MCHTWLYLAVLGHTWPYLISYLIIIVAAILFTAAVTLIDYLAFSNGAVHGIRGCRGRYPLPIPKAVQSRMLLRKLGARESAVPTAVTLHPLCKPSVRSPRRYTARWKERLHVIAFPIGEMPITRVLDHSSKHRRLHRLMIRKLINMFLPYFSDDQHCVASWNTSRSTRSVLVCQARDARATLY